ncbi:MAG: acyltransferase [Oscillospiraceae bacterium]|nr:acyltransferase [Oscillospiraceae bacterium]MBR2937794.1 acyltransferase [Oscillospiraceae bacterium]
MKQLENRICFLDCLRILACLAVIVNHTTPLVFQARDPGGLTWFASITVFFASKFAVPVFYMITGYLLLGKIDPWPKAWVRIRRMVLVILGTGTVYWLVRGLLLEPDTQPGQILENLLSIYRVTPSNALWYLYNYLGMLLMMPFFQKLSAGMTRQDFHIYFGISALFFGILPILGHYYPNAVTNPHFGIPIFSGHICMLFLGQYFARFPLKPSKRGLSTACGIFLGMLAFNVTATWLEAGRNPEAYLFFDNRTYFPILAQSVCVFYAASCLDVGEGMTTVIRSLAAHTFPIYLLADLAMEALSPLYPWLTGIVHPLPAVACYTMLIFLVCLLIAIPLKWIPGLKRLL